MDLDYNKQFPNQLIDGDPTECVALTVADLCGNIDSQLYDPDIVYAYTLRLMNKWPNTAGLDPYTGMLMPIVYGMLPVSFETFTAKTMGELYVANWQNYTEVQRIAAQKWTKKGVKILKSYSDIINYMKQYRAGVSLSMKWYESFNTPNQDGSLPAPEGYSSNHNVAVYDYGFLGLKIKPLLGPTFGNGGYVSLSESTFNLVQQGMWGFDPNANRWLSVAKIALTHLSDLDDILPILTSI